MASTEVQAALAGHVFLAEAEALGHLPDPVDQPGAVLVQAEVALEQREAALVLAEEGITDRIKNKKDAKVSIAYSFKRRNRISFS